MISLEHIKRLREQTGAGVVDAKQALQEAEGDFERAIQILKERGRARALKKTARVAREGVIATYMHSNKKIGSMVKLYCETDFVSRNAEFQELARDVAMHVAALDPGYLRPEDVPQEMADEERKIWRVRLVEAGKPDNMLDTILAGKETAWRGEMALLTQPFVKAPEKTVDDLITEAVSKMGENIQVGGFIRFEL